ncbi:tetratricopeptide repeat protein [Streptomyces nigra]|uniref:tetratricopeptide repeat protein n=1 Tax=Streptomyces nigra TaxID=1827580 RepID=UPI00380C56D5
MEPLLAVIRDIRAEAARQHLLDAPADLASGESVDDVLAETRWRRSWAAEQQRRIQASQKDVVRELAHKALEAEEGRARQAALKDRPRPLRAWTYQRLGVHPAIPGRRSDAGKFVLPTYVSRAHDDALRERLADAVTDRASLLVVVRGESCTGKTRTAAEALTASVPTEFQLLFPADPDSLLAALAADVLGPRSVLWLNEAQDYLAGPSGEAVATALLRRLDTDGPFLAIATLWPIHDKTLTAVPALGENDPYRQARALLAQAYYTYLPSSFADDLDAVRSVTSHDASLATALDIGGADLTQTLAAGPDLVTHYEHPAGTYGIYGKALISVAMDAHRLGASGALPLDFLRDAAPGYLTDSERTAVDPDTWFAGALTYAQIVIKQIIRPLQSVPRSSGIGALPGLVRLADYLQQHGRRTRRYLCPPAAFWDAAERLTSPVDLTHLADAAHLRRRFRHAAQLYCAAAEAGDPHALTWLAQMREKAGDRKEAEQLYRAAGDAGDPDAALRWLAQMREKAGDRKEAERLYRASADAGNPYALTRLAQMRQEAGDRKEAERLFHAAAEAGVQVTLKALAQMREKAKDRKETRFSLAANDTGLVSKLAQLQMRGEPEDWEEIERLVRAAITDSDLAWLARLHEEAEDWDEVERLARAAAESDDSDAHALTWLAALARLHKEAGRREEAERLYLAAVNIGDISALTGLAEVRHGSAEEYRRYGLEADGTLAEPWVWPEPRSLARGSP